MADVAFVTAPGDPLRGLVPAIRTELGRQGMRSSVHESFPDPERSRLFVLVSPRHYVARRGPTALPVDLLLRRTLFLGAEARDDPGDIPEFYRSAGHVFDITQTAVSAMRRAGIPARLLRPGHCPEWDRFDSAAQRDVDIAFSGSPTGRRLELLAEAADVFARHRCALCPSGPNANEVDDRLALLARSKILVNLHAGADDHLDCLSTVEAMHAGAVVVSEHATGLAPFEPGEHLLLASGQSLPWVVDAVLADETRLSRIRERAHARLRDWLPFSPSVAVMRAALIEMLGRPLCGPSEREDVIEKCRFGDPCP